MLLVSSGIALSPLSGALCAACFRAATPGRRAAELLAADPAPDAVALAGEAYVSHAGVTWLRQLWAA